MKTRQQGVAIVLAMGVVALAAMAATAMMVTQSIWLRQNELASEHVQAKALAQAGLDWTRALLSNDLRAGSIDHLGEPWAMQLPPMPVEKGVLAGHIEDGQGAFNLNNLVKNGKIDIAQLAYFQRLLEILGLPTALAATLSDWMDADSTPQGGAEDEFYLALPSPYLAANRPLTDLSELALVRGFDDGVRARLLPFVSALPAFTAVNVNTAPAEVIAAVIDGLSLDDARSLVEKRKRAYFRDYADLLGQLPRGIAPASGNISFSSNYFMVQMRVTIGDAEARSVALLARTSTNWPTIVFRKIL
ncbi:MAG: type II secretion system minor pseudopilin GspK [Gallionella sp.]|nr:type II secretion system minor pseudopilin GspK [Gallionella sp.]